MLATMTLAAAVPYVGWVQRSKSALMSSLQSHLPPDGCSDLLDPEAVAQITCADFTFLERMALHLALVKACAIPSIARALARTPATRNPAGLGSAISDAASLLGEIRALDSTLIASSDPLVQTPPQLASPPSAASPHAYSLEQHRQYKLQAQLQIQHDMAISTARRSLSVLSNDDAVYLIALLVIDPIDWINKHGYRRLTHQEELAGFLIWRSLGLRMLISGIPDSLDALRAFKDKHESLRRGVHPASPALASAIIDVYITSVLPSASMRPYVLPLAKRLIHSLLDPDTQASLRITPPSPVLRMTAHALLMVHTLTVKYLLPAPRVDNLHLSASLPDMLSPVSAPHTRRPANKLSAPLVAMAHSPAAVDSATATSSDSAPTPKLHRKRQSLRSLSKHGVHHYGRGLYVLPEEDEQALEESDESSLDMKRSLSSSNVHHQPQLYGPSLSAHVPHNELQHPLQQRSLRRVRSVPLSVLQSLQS
ncbi:hypothetical protein BC831DRAFT_456102 [Entophlyctis helioformis]|nr:hypothetical protein BC831DRAFT_456102 [Entophlyctis helioformis]